MTSSNNQMHNDIMAAGFKERPPMLALVLSYGDNPAQARVVREETYDNTSPENRKLIDAEAKAIHMILNGIGNDIYSTMDACPNAWEMWLAIEHLQLGNKLKVDTMQVNVRFLQQLQPKWSRFVTIVKQAQDLDKASYHKLFDILKQHQNEVNEIRAERIAMNANPLAPVAATQHYPYTYPQAHQAPKPYKTHATSSRQTPSTRSHATTKNKAKRLSKHLHLHPSQYLKKTIQKVLTTAGDNSGPTFDTETLKKVQSNDDYNVFSIERHHSKKSESINDTYVVEKIDRNVTPDSSDMSTNERGLTRMLKNPRMNEKPCLYNVKYDKNDLANLFVPESEETIRLAKESRLKVGDLVKPYDYTKLNNLYDLFVPWQQKSRDYLYFANDLENNIFITPFQKLTTHLVKRIEYLPTKAFMSKSKQAFDVL
ncbi:hypothetical protein Tco_0431371 [Tanacetum coccineum]